MAILFRVQFTRQSIDSLTPYELIERSLITTSYTPNILNYASDDHGLPFINYTQIEAISWTENLERKNELRADLRNQIENTPNSQLAGYGPQWNPFELTSTYELVCTTQEDFTKHFDILYIDPQFDSTLDLCKQHNISFESDLFDNDVKVESFISRYL